jgi:hypothetical protein
MTPKNWLPVLGNGIFEVVFGVLMTAMAMVAARSAPAWANQEAPLFAVHGNPWAATHEVLSGWVAADRSSFDQMNDQPEDQPTESSCNDDRPRNH